MQVSIITATYNRRKLLVRCIHSVLNQSYSDIEHIIVDDGSTDGTNALFEKGGEFCNESRIRYIRLAVNSGCATPARNAGLDAMTGEAFMIWDSDDELLPEAITTLVSELQAHADVDIVSAPGHFIRAGKMLSFPRVPYRRVSFSDKLRGVLPQNEAPILIRSRSLGDVRYESRNLDYIFMTKLSNRCEWIHVDKLLANVYLESDDASLTLHRKKKSLQNSIERARVIGPFLKRYKHEYVTHAPAAYGNIAYGAALGYLLANDRFNARFFGGEAFRYATKLKKRLVVLLVWLPFMRKFLSRWVYVS